MYVELHNYNELEQKVLYYKLNSIFNLENEDVEKFAGIYAIFKDNVCLYVGQSFNLASRLATHLRGKYQEADYIYIWDIQQFTDSDLQKLKKDKQKHFLDECEKLVMSALKPIENIDIDMDYVSEVEVKNTNLEQMKFSIKITDEAISITNGNSYFLEAIRYETDFLKAEYDPSIVEKLINIINKNHNVIWKFDINDFLKKEESDIDFKSERGGI